MTNFTKSKLLKYSSKEIFDLIIDIEKYPQFLPWCRDAKIIEIINPNLLIAYMVVNFKGISQKYTSKVSWGKNINDDYSVDIKAIEGAFKRLDSSWRISNIDNIASNLPNKANIYKSQVHFTIDFEFSSFILQKMIGTMFGYASEKIINSFEKRAEEVYSK